MTYYEKNKERIKAYNRKHYAENRERKMQQSMEWQKAHPLKMYEIHRRYYLKNAEKRQNEEYIILEKNKSKPYVRAKDAKFDPKGFREWVKDGIEQAVKGEEHGTDT